MSVNSPMLRPASGWISNGTPCSFATSCSGVDLPTTSCANVVGAAARAQLDDRTVELREPDDRVGELATERAKAFAVHVDDRGLAEHVAREAGQAIARRRGQADTRGPVPTSPSCLRHASARSTRRASSVAVDLCEAIDGRRHHAQPLVVGIRDREADVVVVLVHELNVLAGGEARPFALHIPPTTTDEAHRSRGRCQLSQLGAHNWSNS